MNENNVKVVAQGTGDSCGLFSSGGQLQEGEQGGKIGLFGLDLTEKD